METKEINVSVPPQFFWQVLAIMPEFRFTINKEHKAELTKDGKTYNIYIKK